MDVGALARRFGPAIGIGAGTALVGGIASFAAIRHAGTTSTPDTGTEIVSVFNRPVVTGGLIGVLAPMVLGRTPVGRHLAGLSGLLMIPAGIGGAMLGASFARNSLRDAYPEEYRQQEALIDPAIAAAQTMFRRAGADEEVLGRVPVRYDRSHLNATYHPPLGPFGDDILVGRHSDTGVPLGTMDIFAHEFAHKVIHEYAPLMTRSIGGDAAKIHESLADTFAMAVDTDDWLVGEDAVPGGGRSFSDPEVRGALRDGSPVAAPITREQLEASEEEHLGAGVGNKVAWRIGSALGREEMAALYVAALERRELGFNASYSDLARVVRAAAVDRWGAGSEQAGVVDDAWRQAGY